MAVSLVAIASNDQVTAVADSGTTTDTLYTSTGVTTQINALTVTNTSTSQVWMSFWILPSGVAASSVPATWTQAIPAGAGGVLDAAAIVSGLLGHIIPAGGTLKCDAGTTNVCHVTASGIAVS